MNTRTLAMAAGAAFFLAPFLVACSDDPAPAPDATGGASSTGGAAGSTETGGALATSGGAGGSNAAGSGAAPSAGGGPNTGGVTASGGSGGEANDGSAPDGAAPSSGGAGSGGSPATGGSGGAPSTPDAVWRPLTVMAVVNPKDHGASGNGTTDDLAALKASVDALPASGGVVYLPRSATFKKTNLLVVTKSHVKFWAPNGQATLAQSIGGQRRRQSVICRNEGCGFFGVKFTSDAAARFDALEDNHVSADHGRLVEVVGCDLAGAAAAGVFLYGSREHYIEGNYVHHTWADHVHHTDGARESWVWENHVFNENPSRGDDGVACVTYGPASPRCGDMEWWSNTILHTGWGRGFSVIGGNDISIHDNWAIGVAGAGIIVASEGSYDSASSARIGIRRNKVTQCGHGIEHPGILISGLNDAAEPIRDVTLADNVSAGNTGAPYRAEGAYTNVTNTGLRTAASDLPAKIPARADVRLADTAVLRTRDVSHAPAAARAGLHRIHVREAPSGSGFEQRFEYVFAGPDAAVRAFTGERAAAGDRVTEVRAVSGTTYALVLSGTPLTLPAGLSGVSFRTLRAGDLDGSLSWLWQRVDTGAY